MVEVYFEGQIRKETYRIEDYSGKSPLPEGTIEVTFNYFIYPSEKGETLAYVNGIVKQGNSLSSFEEKSNLEKIFKFVNKNRAPPSNSEEQ